MSEQTEANDNATTAADDPTPSLGGHMMLLDIDDIQLSEITNVRPFTSKQETERELKELQLLMASIEQEGQLQPVIVMRAKNGGKPWDLLYGRRRYKAISMHNLASDEPMKIKAIVGDPAKTAAQLFRRAAHENLLREGINPMDMARNIRTVRKNMKWTKAADTVSVANFFEVSEAQITQTEKLLELDDDFQQAIADGTLTRDGAYALLKVKATKRKDIYDDALTRQKSELGESQIVRSATNILAPAAPTADARAAVDLIETRTPLNVGTGPAISKAAKKSGAAKAGGVKAKHIKAAARAADPDTHQSRSKSDIVDFFVGCQGPVYGYEDGAVYQFVENFKKWVKGNITDGTMEKYFARMVKEAARGTPPAKTKVDPFSGRIPRPVKAKLKK